MKINKVLFVLCLLFAFFMQFKLLGSFIISENFLISTITFFSILFGFYITSLAIFVTSKYVSSLYKITDKNNPTKTLLNSLIQNYQTGLTVSLITITYFLCIIFIKSNISLNEEIRLALWYTYLVPSLIIFNIFYSYKMLRDLIKIIIQEAKS